MISAGSKTPLPGDRIGSLKGSEVMARSDLGIPLNVIAREAGVPVAIALAYGCTESWFTWMVRAARNELGPEWFPERATPPTQPAESEEGVLA